MSKKITLLEKAKAIKLEKRKIKSYSDEEIKLVLAWLEDEITMTQAAKALGYGSPANIGYSFARMLKATYQQGKLQIKK